MTSNLFPIVVIGLSLSVAVISYLLLSHGDRSYINILTPSFLVGIPAFYLLPIAHIFFFGTDGSAYAYVYVYGTLAFENAIFVYAYTRARKKVARLPFFSSYSNFGWIATACLFAAILLYLPLVFQFREFILDPREIYKATRTGFGLQSFVSSTLAFMSVIFVLFSKRSILAKTVVIAGA